MLGEQRLVRRETPEPDWLVVVRKELGDLMGRLGRLSLFRTLGVVAVFGVLVPLRFDTAANLPAVFAIFMAFLPARLVAIDSYAGERERGTLESLLASPLSDRGIAVGKVVASTVYGAVRGWVFLAVWLLTSGLLRVTALAPNAPLPSAQVTVSVVMAAVVVAYAAAVFGVWQSAHAPSVRAIVESNGLLRLILILVVFFGAPWLLGLLSPDGRAPALPLPGAEETVSLHGVRTAVAAAPTTAAVTGMTLVVLALLVLCWLTVNTLHRCRRESLALVTAASDERVDKRSRRAVLRRLGFSQPGSRGTTPSDPPGA